MARFKRCIEAEAGAAGAEKSIIETERFDATSDYAQKAEWIKNAVRRLEKEAGSPTARKVMQACGMKCCGPAQQKRVKQFMKESKSVKELLARMNERGVGGGRMKLKNRNTIVGGYDWCYCGRVKVSHASVGMTILGCQPNLLTTRGVNIFRMPPGRTFPAC